MRDEYPSDEFMRLYEKLLEIVLGEEPFPHQCFIGAIKGAKVSGITDSFLDSFSENVRIYCANRRDKSQATADIFDRLGFDFCDI